MADDRLTIGGETFTSRLIMGTGGAPSLDVLERRWSPRGTELTTVAMRRLDPAVPGSVLDVLRRRGIGCCPTPPAASPPGEAVLTARLAREALGTDWVKLEVIADERTLLPDPIETAGRRRDAGRRRVHGAAVHRRRPGAGAEAGGRGLRGGHAAGLADRLRARHPQPAQHPADRRARRGCR